MNPMDEWISVKDRLPESGETTLVYNGDIDVHGFWNGRWLDYDENGYPFEVLYITHWMPLPEPPKEESGK